jgi:hypothetical protein
VRFSQQSVFIIVFFEGFTILKINYVAQELAASFFRVEVTEQLPTKLLRNNSAHGECLDGCAHVSANNYV